jgi:2-oxoisovalerate dehydrogenase E1 component alpha subunit
MPKQLVANFQIYYQQYLDAAGQLQVPLPEYLQEANLWQQLYQGMLRARLFDQKAIALQRTGKLGTYPSCLGQEAIGVGIAAMMQAEDVLCPYYREQAAMLWRGISMQEILAFWGGDERGNCFAASQHDLPFCIPIATQLLHAAGVAKALQYQQRPQVAVAVVGDGGTSRGDFYEALNIAGCWRLPMVIVVNNNQWAISLPLAAQTASQTLAQKAIAAGVHGEQVDGNDVFAVAAALSDALQRARAGAGPTLIEALSYRLSDHTTADDASRYRAPEECLAKQAFDPIPRLRQFLEAQQLWDQEAEASFIETSKQQIETAVAAYLSKAPAPLGNMFDYLYASLPAAYQAQRAEVLSLYAHT